MDRQTYEQLDRIEAKINWIMEKLEPEDEEEIETEQKPKIKIQKKE